MSLILKINQYLTEIWPSQCCLRGNVAIESLNPNKYWDHMQIFRIKLQKLGKILGFGNYWNLRFQPNRLTKISVTRSIFKIQGLFFCHGFHGLIFWPWISWQTSMGPNLFMNFSQRVGNLSPASFNWQTNIL